ncbi:heme lyase NrfEFG subunit NrfF [Vibrio sp. Of7-15]|uniref:heme lyase NrfEFG subunit NrfF n=1 Tax=Vibrio sp. Of7-15 TaxID=2724879 RepID=UPI001EF33629|nr:heme lyase NrfEFG subunit NrfF [Vibrio sp. Of7-15]
MNAIFSAADLQRIEQVETFQFESEQEQTRAVQLAKALRCPQCQNQNLMESNSPIAKDLRLEVYKMVDEGKTDTEIIGFMIDRFGDFVLYQPKFEPRTYLLWLGPVALLLLFTFIGYRKVKSSINE